MIVFEPYRIDELIIIQVVNGDKLYSHYFKNEWEAFKFWKSFK
jgi:hypothetical protein